MAQELERCRGESVVNKRIVFYLRRRLGGDPESDAEPESEVVTGPKD